MELLLLRILNKLLRIARAVFVDNPVSKKIRMHDYEIHFASASGVNLFRGVFDTFEQAIDSAPHTKPIGYDNPGPASMYQERTKQVYASDYPVLYWMAQILKPNDRVFDIGGHIGVGYYSYEKYLTYPDNMRWRVCDVPEVVSAGKQLAEQSEVNQLSFTSDFSELDGHNILFASGSLQYIETPVAEIIHAVTNKPEHVIINLLPVHEDHTFITLQNIGTAFCAYQITQRAQLIESMRAIGYACIDSWSNEEKSCEIPFYPTYSLDRYWGFYFRSNNSE